MYQTDRRAALGKLALSATLSSAMRQVKLAGTARRWQSAMLRAILAGIASLGSLRVMPIVLSEQDTWQDPRNPHNW